MPKGIYSRKKYRCKHCKDTFAVAWKVAQHYRTEHPDKIKRKKENHATTTNHSQESFNFGYACASVQALIATLAERDKISAEVLTAGIVEYLSGTPKR